MSKARSAGVLIAVLLFVGALAWTVRELNNARITYAPGGDPSQGWFSMDPDSHYHMRRLERVWQEGLPVAETDPRMNFPHGARIPWPPYYTYVLYALTWPLVAGASDQHRTIEYVVASMPRVFAALTSMIVAAAAWRLARKSATSVRAAAALVAGVSFAWLRISLDYSVPGNGDHHAWVSMLLAALLAIVARALEHESLSSRASSLRLGIAAGLVAGVLLGSWVGGLVYILMVELALGVLLLVHARDPRAGTATLGIAFHLALVLSVLPAVLTSPWKSDLPWIVVNLSWFHVVHPLLGALVFVPLPFLDARASRAWPWIVASALAALGAAIAFGDFALARGVREGFEWVSRTNTFMAFVTESQPLLWGDLGGIGAVKRSLGFAAFASPIVLAWMAWRAWRTRALELAPWIIATVVLAAQAITQRRFAEQFGVPMTLGLAWCFADFVRRRVFPAWAVTLAAIALAVAAQWPSVNLTRMRGAEGQHWVSDGFTQKYRGFRDLHTWLRVHARHDGLRDHPTGESDFSVLASWDHGHSLEWAAECATVATNFGSYLGEDSYLDPWRVLLEEQPARVEELMDRRGVRYVLITSDFTKDLAVAARLLRYEDRAEFIVARKGEYGRPAPRYYRTLAGRLMLGGRSADLTRGELVGDSLNFLRLVYVSPMELGVVPQVPYSNGPYPAGWIWERVAGAVVTARGQPGEVLSLSLDLTFASSNTRLTWVGNAVADASGVARVRVPYNTTELNGDARALGPVAWRIGERAGTVAISETAVRGGQVVEIP